MARADPTPPTPWADAQRHRLRASLEATPWYLKTTTLDGIVVTNWHLAIVMLLCFLWGPSSLGYGILAAMIYLIYTRIYLKGHTPSSLFEDYKRSVVAGSEKKRKKTKKGSR